MSERSRFLFATLCGLVLAVGVHIVVVLGAPTYADHDAFSRLSGTVAADKAELITAPGSAAAWLPKPDPATAMAACAFDLEDGPVRVSTKTNALFQSLSFHARGGSVFFAVTDRAAVRGDLELVVMTRRQLDEALAAEDEDAPTRDVRIVSPTTQGLVIVRAVAPFSSLTQQAQETVKAVSCTIDAAE